MTIYFKGYNLGVDKKADLFFNKKLISNVSLKYGFNLNVNAVIGDNTLDIIGIGLTKSFNIKLEEINFNMILELEYSRYLGNFTENVHFANYN